MTKLHFLPHIHTQKKEVKNSKNTETQRQAITNANEPTIKRP
jgi:hypothetical protein